MTDEKNEQPDLSKIDPFFDTGIKSIKEKMVRHQRLEYDLKDFLALLEPNIKVWKRDVLKQTILKFKERTKTMKISIQLKGEDIYDEIYDKIFDLIANNPTEEYNIYSIAQELKISTDFVSELVKDLIGDGHFTTTIKIGSILPTVIITEKPFKDQKAIFNVE